ncbi:MAG: ATP-binding cassette domain-containing protein [Acidobacteriota bacterium]
MDAIRLSNVSKTFDGLRAVADLSMSVPEGSLFGLLGPNGAGKTTTIRMILSIILPDAGSIAVLGKPAGQDVNKFIGYLPEERGLYRKMKVGDMLMFMAELKGVDKAAGRRGIDHWLERLDLLSWKKRRVEELSKGMQQKLQFIATILHQPRLMILDEPFSGLDPINVNLLKEIVLEMSRGGCTVIFSTHRMEQVEQMCDAICLINKAQLVLHGDPKSIRREYGKNTVVVDFEGAPDSILGEWPGVEKYNSSGRWAEVRLKRDADSREYLQYLVRHFRLNKFEVVEPSLEEIFIEKVRASNEADLDRSEA